MSEPSMVDVLADVRPANLDDAAAIADINVRAWRHAYRGIISDAYLDSLDASTLTVKVRETLRRHGTVLVAERSVVVGFAWISDSRDEGAPPRTAEVIALYVDPEHERRGIGRGLMRESIAVARLQRATTVTLWVLEANASARAFYANAGFSPDGAIKLKERGGAPVSEVRYARALLDDPPWARITRAAAR